MPIITGLFAMPRAVAGWFARGARRAQAGIFLAMLFGASVAGAQIPIGQIGPESVTVRGRVAEVFGDRFVVEDASGRALVEFNDMGAALPVIANGETLAVTGLARNRVIVASRIVRENGEVVYERMGAPDARRTQAGSGAAGASEARGLPGERAIGEALRPLGLTPVGAPVRHRKHIEVPARTADGREMLVYFDRFGRLWEVRDAYRGPKDARDIRLSSASDAERAVRQQGYSPRGEVERKKHHFEVLATNRQNELVELHIDLSGYIYKQVWIR